MCPQPSECIWNLDLDFIMSISSSFLDALPRNLRIAERSLTIGEEIGRGSFGVVNKGMFNGQPVCIKVCVRLLCGDVLCSLHIEACFGGLQSMHALNNPELYGVRPGSREESKITDELIAEMTTLASVHNDRIVALEGICFDAGTGRPKYIVLELASGSLEWFLLTLRDLLSVSRFVGICEDILKALGFLHSREPPICTVT
jgi:serine/threonine protein kinase